MLYSRQMSRPIVFAPPDSQRLPRPRSASLFTPVPSQPGQLPFGRYVRYLTIRNRPSTFRLSQRHEPPTPFEILMSVIAYNAAIHSRARKLISPAVYIILSFESNVAKVSWIMAFTICQAGLAAAQPRRSGERGGKDNRQ